MESEVLTPKSRLIAAVLFFCQTTELPCGVHQLCGLLQEAAKHFPPLRCLNFLQHQEGPYCERVHRAVGELEQLQLIELRRKGRNETCDRIVIRRNCSTPGERASYDLFVRAVRQLEELDAWRGQLQQAADFIVSMLYPS